MAQVQLQKKPSKKLTAKEAEAVKEHLAKLTEKLKNWKECPQAKEKVAKAKAALILSQPFFASIICNLLWSEDPRIPTMATNGSWVKYNADFVNDLTIDELKFVACHEVGHVMFQHMFRRGERHPMKWNMAGDYIINDLLNKENVGTMPKGGLHDSALVQKGEGTTEGVYDLIPDNEDSKDGSGPGGGNGTAIDECMDGTGTDGNIDTQAEADIKVMLAQAAAAAKMCGKLSANLERFVGKALEAKVDWRDVLRRFINSKAKVDLTYARPKRRFVAEDIYLPSLSGESMGELCIAVDCSGSIGPQELDEFAAEILSIKEDCQPLAIHVVYFDSSVCHYDKFERDDDLKIAPHGGGGTAFSPIFQYINQRDINPVACVILTDLCCSDFGPAPHFPVLWVSTMKGDAPWGEIVLMNPKGL